MVSKVTSGRRGFTLLEVLVAMGILIAGLASVAALLPAAGSRLAEATAIDRAATMSTNGVADLLNRRALAASMFNAQAGKAAVFGEIPGTVAHSSLIRAAVTAGFFLEDDLVYRGGTTSLPVNSFESTGVREFKRGICFGATLVPVLFNEAPVAGSSARLSIVVFKKPSPSGLLLNLQRTNGVYTVSPGDEQTRKQFAAGCSYMLVLPSGGLVPRWFRIAASWTVGQSPSATSYVTFEDSAVNAYGSTITAFGFQGILRVDEQIVSLE